MFYSNTPTRVNLRPKRDSQRKKVYRAEAVLKPFAEPLPTVKDVERFFRKVWRYERLHTAYPRAFRRDPPKVKDGRGRRAACAFGGYAVALPLWARNSHIAVHELAHIVDDREYGGAGAAHDWQYCEVFLRLTLYILGREAHDALKASFREHKVKFRAPRTRQPLSPERKAKLIATLATARAAKVKPTTQPFGRQLDLD